MELSDLSINNKGELIETIDWGERIISYYVVGVTDHSYFGLYLTYRK